MRISHLSPTLLLVLAGTATAQSATCEAVSRPQRTPVVELYTSEGCSSCPPADRWLSTLKPAAAQGRVVAQAFHVGYWDYLGWVDRFALAVGTERQRDLAVVHGRRGVYTPQLVRNGEDWRDYDSALLARPEPAGAAIQLVQREPGLVEASVTPADPQRPWAAYWTTTEHGHASKVRSGENAGETLRHDFVVRQYVPTATHRGPQRLLLRTVPRDGDAPRAVNLVVFEPGTHRPLQALSLTCAG